MKFKQPHPGFELGMPCPFTMMIIITPQVLPTYLGMDSKRESRESVLLAHLDKDEVFILKDA